MPIISKFGFDLNRGKKNRKYKNRNNLPKKKKSPETKNTGNQIAGILILALFIYAFLCSVFRIFEKEASLGSVGASLSEYLLNFSFGYPVLIIIWLFIIVGGKLLTGKHKKLFTVNFLYSFYVTVWLSYLFGFIKLVKAGVIEESMHVFGIFGKLTAEFSTKVIGNIGTVILLTASLFTILLLWIEFDIGKFISKVSESIQLFLQVIKNRIKEVREKRKQNKRFKEIKKKITVEEHLSPVKDDKIPAPKKDQEPGKKSEPEPVSNGARMAAEVRKADAKDFPKIFKGEETDIEEKSEEKPVKRSDDGQIEIGEMVEEKLLDEEVLRESIEKYQFPSLDYLEQERKSLDFSEEELIANAKILEQKLADFGVNAKVVQVNPGPVITMYEVIPATGVKISRIVSLADDLALAMKAKGIRIVAPIPGKGVVGIEIPNKNRTLVRLRSLLSTDKFKDSESRLTLALGKTISGEVFITDLTKMPHLLIAGATGSGKSVGLNVVIASILYKSLPNEVKFILIDPKKLELSTYAKLKYHHLLWFHGIEEDVITTPANTVLVLNAVVHEMEQRYDVLAKAGVRSIADYNKKIKSGWRPTDAGISSDEGLFYIVVIVDELADLMLMAAKEVEEPIARIAQMARAVGIHLVLATQRPSVDVITGVIKANFPARIAFNVASKIDSRTIIDGNGAETLLGEGDMLYLPPAQSKPVRMQCPYVSSDEIDRIIDHIASQPKFPSIKFEVDTSKAAGRGENGYGNGERDPIFNEALKIVLRHQQGSISLLQRRLRLGYARAARIMDELEAAGIVGPYDGSKGREVLYDESYLDDLEE
ncbi:DNA translocase FtsK 4TM domain-containing protein [candidate division KSB1 bacterium]